MFSLYFPSFYFVFGACSYSGIDGVVSHALASRVRPKAMSSSARHHAKSAVPRVSLFKPHSLSADEETSAPWHPDAGTWTVQGPYAWVQGRRATSKVTATSGGRLTNRYAWVPGRPTRRACLGVNLPSTAGQARCRFFQLKFCSDFRGILMNLLLFLLCEF